MSSSSAVAPRDLCVACRASSSWGRARPGPASRRGYGVRQRLTLLMVRPLTTLGFGVAVSILLFVPILNLFLMPLAVAGGTRLFLDLSEYAAHEA